MSLGIGIKLESSVVGVNPARVTGVAIARAQFDLYCLAEELDLPPLGEFVSFSRDEREVLAQDMGFETASIERSTEHWFPATEGLRVVRGLLRHLEANPDAPAAGPEIVTELRLMETVLEAASKSQVGFHFSVEY